MTIDRVLVLSLFGGYSLKLLALGAGPADAAVVLVLAAAHFGHAYFNHDKQIDELKQELSKVNTSIAEQNVIIGELRTNVTSVKMASSMRSVK